MSADLLEARPTLRAWLDEYAAIEADYLARLADWGIRIAPRDADADVVRAAKDRLREKGAQFRNGDAGVVCGNLSSACVACTGGRGSKTFFLSLACNRSCYFCFNANQADYADRLRVNDAWRDEVDAFADACGGEVTHVGLTGGGANPCSMPTSPWRSALTFASAFRVPISGCTPPAISLTNRCSIACATPGSTSCA